MTTYTQQELVDELTRRFGPDPATWSWICPACGDVASIADFREALKNRPRERNGSPVLGDHIAGQECIGRSLGVLETTDESWAEKRAAGEARGCSWVAYGLIPGPSVVLMPGGHELRAFDIAEPAEAGV